MKQLKFRFPTFIALLLSVITLLITCDRLNLYDIASGKSRIAYAIAYDGANYTLILANIDFVKTYHITPAFTAVLHPICQDIFYTLKL